MLAFSHERPTLHTQGSRPRGRRSPRRSRRRPAPARARRRRGGAPRPARRGGLRHRRHVQPLRRAAGRRAGRRATPCAVPWHHACFSLRTGEALSAPALNPVDRLRRSRAQAAPVFVTRQAAPAGDPRGRERAPASAPASVGIVGAGAAGNCVAEELRRLGLRAARSRWSTRDRDAPYDRPNLSKDYLAGNAPEEWIPLHPPELLRRARHRAGAGPAGGRARPRPQGAHASTTGARASSARSSSPPAPSPSGSRSPARAGRPCFTLRTLADSRAIIEAAKGGAAGGGARGELHRPGGRGLAARAQGSRCTWSRPDERPLERVLGAEVGDFVRRVHEEHGVVFHLGQTASGARARPLVADVLRRARSPRTSSSSGWECGRRWRWREAAGLRVDNGDRGRRAPADGRRRACSPSATARAGRTRAPAAWSASSTGWWPQRQGQAVARTLAGVGGPFTDVPFFWSQHYDVSLNYVGHAPRYDQVVVDGSLEKHDATRPLPLGRASCWPWPACSATARAWRPSWRWRGKSGADPRELRFEGRARHPRRRAAAQHHRLALAEHDRELAAAPDPLHAPAPARPSVGPGRRRSSAAPPRPPPGRGPACRSAAVRPGPAASGPARRP